MKGKEAIRGMETERDLPNPQVRYVVVPMIEVGEESEVELRERLHEIVESTGKLMVRFEVRFWDPMRQNNRTWRGMTVNAHFDDLRMAEAVVGRVRDMIIRGQKVGG